MLLSEIEKYIYVHLETMKSLEGVKYNISKNDDYVITGCKKASKIYIQSGYPALIKYLEGSADDLILEIVKNMEGKPKEYIKMDNYPHQVIDCNVQMRGR